MTICGRNTTTEPTPAMIPSVSRSRRKLSGNAPSTHAPSAPAPPSSASVSGAAQANTAWKMTNSSTSRISGPAHGFSNTLSRRSPRWRALEVSYTVAFAMVRASSRLSVASMTGRSACVPICARASAMALFRSSSPRRRTATVSITGTPRACERIVASSLSPSRSAMSIMLSATMVGLPSASTSCANTRCCSRLPASSTSTSTSGSASPGNSPCTTCRVTSSSGLDASNA